MPPDSFGILAGDGRLPAIIAESLKEDNFRIVTACLTSGSASRLNDLTDVVRTFRPEQFGTVPEYFLDHDVDRLVMAGSIERSILFDDDRIDNADEIVQSTLEKSNTNKDESLLENAIDLLEGFGLTVCGIDELLSERLTPDGHHAGPDPSDQQLCTVEVLVDVGTVLADRGVGQSVLGKRGAVTAVEAAEGTNQTIRRAGNLVESGLVMVKVARSDQDFRVDVPVVGESTVSELVKANADLLAFEAQRTLWLQREECKSLADKHDLTLIGWER